jgi:hypothetical protein
MKCPQCGKRMRLMRSDAVWSLAGIRAIITFQCSFCSYVEIIDPKVKQEQL